MPVVKLSYPEYLPALLRQLPQGQFRWGEYTFAINDTSVTSCDYWVVYNNVLQTETIQCPASNTVFMSGEPETVYTYPERFLAQFYQVASCQPNMPHEHAILSLTGQTWFVEKSFDELIAMPAVTKEKRISVLCSDKQFTPGHKQRYQFVRQLKQHFGDQLEWFGRGVQDFKDKWDVLAPYEFSIAIENSVYPHYLSEKISDCFLAYTVPLYFGAPNVSKYFDPQSYIQIDLYNIQKTIDVIDNVLTTPNSYQDRVAALGKARDQYLHQYQFFPLIVSILEGLPAGAPKTTVIIKPESAFSVKKYMKKQVKRLLGRT